MVWCSLAARFTSNIKKTWFGRWLRLEVIQERYEGRELVLGGGRERGGRCREARTVRSGGRVAVVNVSVFLFYLSSSMSQTSFFN